MRANIHTPSNLTIQKFRHLRTRTVSMVASKYFAAVPDNIYAMLHVGSLRTKPWMPAWKLYNHTSVVRAAPAHIRLPASNFSGVLGAGRPSCGLPQRVLWRKTSNESFWQGTPLKMYRWKQYGERTAKYCETSASKQWHLWEPNSLCPYPYNRTLGSFWTCAWQDSNKRTEHSYSNWHRDRERNSPMLKFCCCVVELRFRHLGLPNSDFSAHLFSLQDPKLLQHFQCTDAQAFQALRSPEEFPDCARLFIIAQMIKLPRARYCNAATTASAHMLAEASEYCFESTVSGKKNSLSLTEFQGKLGEFCEKLGEFALAHK